MLRPYDVISGLMTSHPQQIGTTQLRTVWGLHVSMIKWSSLTLIQLNSDSRTKKNT